jgi:hypothetical protein
MENDRLVAMSGNEPHYVQDFFDETDWRVIEEDNVPPPNVIEMAAWFENANRMMGRGRR